MKAWIKIAIAGVSGLAVGGVGGYFLGRELQRRRDDEVLEATVSDLKAHYEVKKEEIPVVRQAAVGVMEETQEVYKSSTEGEMIFKSQVEKPPLEEWLKQHGASPEIPTDYAAIYGSRPKQGPPPPPIDRLKFDEALEHQSETSVDDPEYDQSLQDHLDQMGPQTPEEEAELAKFNAFDSSQPPTEPPLPNQDAPRPLAPGGDAPDTPFLISDNDYANTFRHLTKKSMVAYEEDHVLVDDDDPEVQADATRWLGTFDPVSLFWQASDDDLSPAETIWVRNFAEGCDIEVTLYHRSWADVQAQRSGGW